MHKSNTDSSELEGSDDMDPAPSPAPRLANQNVNVPDGMVSIRFLCLTEEKKCCGCCNCCCCKDSVYLHQHQIVLPEDTTVDQFLDVATRKVGSETRYTTCTVNGLFHLRRNDPIGPTIKSYKYLESPLLSLSYSTPVDKSCCLLI